MRWPLAACRYTTGGRCGDRSRVFFPSSAARLRIPLQALEVRTHVGRMLITEVTVLLESPVDHLLERRRDIGIHAYGSDRIAVEDGFGDQSRAASSKRQGARGHLVENDAERKEICATVQYLGPYLFGRHVGNGSQRRSRT